MATTVVLDDDSDVEEVVAITNWKDERMYNAVLGVCLPCYVHRKEKVKLPNRTKAIYHWANDGSGKKDVAATIKDCPCSGKVPGLQAWAREEVHKKCLAREKRKVTDAQQAEKDSARESSSEVTIAPAGSLISPGCSGSSANKRPRVGSIADHLSFTSRWATMLDRAIANLVIEEATPLALVQKPAFRELIDNAIGFGANVGQGVYSHMGKAKLRNGVIPDVITRQSTELASFDMKLAKFGGVDVVIDLTLVDVVIDLTLVYLTLDVVFDLTRALTLDLVHPRRCRH